MSHKIKDMGNMSRAGDEMKKKLEISFSTQIPDTGKSIDTDLRNYGNDAIKPTSINKEIHNSQSVAPQSDVMASAATAGSRYKKVVPRVVGSAKAKATFCLDSVAVEQLNQIYIRRLSTYQKSDRSSLICEAISLLFEKEKIHDNKDS